jgi:hypothetical protein
MVGHGPHLASRAAAGDDHIVGDRAFSDQADDGDILGLVIVELVEGEPEERLDLVIRFRGTLSERSDRAFLLRS